MVYERAPFQGVHVTMCTHIDICIYIYMCVCHWGAVNILPQDKQAGLRSREGA